MVGHCWHCLDREIPTPHEQAGQPPRLYHHPPARVGDPPTAVPFESAGVSHPYLTSDCPAKKPPALANVTWWFVCSGC